MNEEKKMKVWECTGCGIQYGTNHKPCILTMNDDSVPDQCPVDMTYTHRNWHETTRYEITERKPDYKGMINQFGAFYHSEDTKKTSPYYGNLTGYIYGERLPFQKDGGEYWAFFTPYAEPQELDPITLEPVK